DGFRVIARKNGAQVRLYSRPGNDLTYRFGGNIEYKSNKTNVRFPLWRKKVDNSIFRDLGTAVPNWICQLWQFDTIFPGIVKSSDDVAKVAVKFEGRTYEGRVVSSHPKGRAKKHYRFYFNEALAHRLKEVFLMSHMRDLESRLSADSTNIE